MIPKNVIEKAIEGGWANAYALDWDGHAEAIIDPLFWQSLGKALGWMSGDWKGNAHQFFDLLLTSGDTSRFWKDLLENKR